LCTGTPIGLNTQPIRPLSVLAYGLRLLSTITVSQPTLGYGHNRLNARRVQTTEAFRADYAERAGIESAHEQAVRRCGLRQCRYIGLAKTRLQHVVTAVAVNLIRLGEWLAGTPLAPTRRSRFAALQGAIPEGGKGFATSVTACSTPERHAIFGYIRLIIATPFTPAAGDIPWPTRKPSLERAA
jgi:hypothetical protein